MPFPPYWLWTVKATCGHHCRWRGHETIDGERGSAARGCPRAHFAVAPVGSLRSTAARVASVRNERGPAGPKRPRAGPVGRPASGTLAPHRPGHRNVVHPGRCRGVAPLDPAPPASRDRDRMQRRPRRPVPRRRAARAAHASCPRRALALPARRDSPVRRRDGGVHRGRPRAGAAGRVDGRAGYSRALHQGRAHRHRADGAARGSPPGWHRRHRHRDLRGGHRAPRARHDPRPVTGRSPTRPPR
ncbi:hypothetical protein BH20ACT24_BH20ACT24_21750 [soil metagenome]